MRTTSSAFQINSWRVTRSSPAFIISSVSLPMPLMFFILMVTSWVRMKTELILTITSEGGYLSDHVVLGLYLELGIINNFLTLFFGIFVSSGLLTVLNGDLLDVFDDSCPCLDCLSQGSAIGLDLECQLYVLIFLVDLALDDVGEHGALSLSTPNREQQCQSYQQDTYPHVKIINLNKNYAIRSPALSFPINFLSTRQTPQLFKTNVCQNIYVIYRQFLYSEQEWILQYQIRYKEAPMAKVGKQKIDQLIGQMSHYDPDNMEMGAKRLTELILSGQVNLDADQKVANIVRQAFMKQIQSQNDTVQSQAIKYLAEIVPKLPSEQVEIIYQKILQHITNLNIAQKKRERYGACAAAVIHQASQEFGKKLGNLFLKSIKKLLEFKDKKTELEFILINIITQFIKKWPHIASQLTYDRKNLVVYLLKNIQVKTKLDIIKKSQACLGKLALILDRDLINIVLNDNDWGLIKFISKNSGKNNIDLLKHTRNGLLCLTQVIKTHNIQIRFWVKDIASLLIGIINQLKTHQDVDNIEVICDILDASLTSLSYVIKIFAKELREELQQRNNRFTSFLLELLFFNVQNMMIYAGEEMQEESYQESGDYQYENEVDEKCWKVRRSVLYYISFLARYDKHFLEGLKEGELIPQIGTKLIQQHNMVSEMAFYTFNELIDIISIQKMFTNDEEQIDDLSSLTRVKSSARDIADHIIKQIIDRIRIIFNNSKFNDQLKVQSSKILLKLVQIYNHILISKEQETFKLINFITEELKKTGIVENKANLLLALRQLVAQEYPFESYQHIYAYYFDTIDRTNNVKLQNICLLGIRKFLDLFHNKISSNKNNYQRAVNLIKSKVKELDSDKLVKNSVCKCLSELLQKYKLQDSDLIYFLDFLTQKLKIQVEKVYIIECLIHINPSSIKTTKDSIKSLEAVVKQIAQNLGSNNYELNAKSIEGINHLMAVIGTAGSQKLLQDLLQKSKFMLGQGKIPAFFKYITQINPKLLKPYAEYIVKSTESYYIATFIKQKVIDVVSCLKILKSLDQQRAKKISQTLGAIKLEEGFIIKQIDESPWGRIMVGALGYIGSQNTLNLLFQYINDFKSDQAKSDACSAIGNIISRNPDKLIPALIQKANASADLYTFLFILKQMLTYSQSAFACLTNVIQWLLQKCQSKFDVQSNYYITSECVGKLAFLNTAAARTVISNAKSPIQNRRLIVASSLRFGLQNREVLEYQFLPEYIEAIVGLAADEKVRVREGAIKSLISVGQSYPKGLKHYAADQKFWKTVIESSRINDNLIVTIDYGICKEIRDDGKNLRLQVFNLFQILVKKIHFEPWVIERLLQTSLFRINEQTSNDIVLKRLSLIKSLCELDFAPFIRVQTQFIAKINPKDGLLKKYEKSSQEERTEIYLKGILKELFQINTLAKQENVDRLGALIVQLRNHAAFSALLQQLDKAAK